MSVKLLHLADLHLDSPFKSLSSISKSLAEHIQQATYQSFEKLVTLAIQRHVDIVVIAGDTFNSEQPSVHAQLFFQAQLKRLISENITVVMCYGNHDFYNGKLLIKLPEKVHIFPNDIYTFEVATRSGKTVALSGFSYYTRHISHINWSKFSKKSHHDVHVGVLHGQIGESGVYAPFMPKYLENLNYDYWALGHIHQRGIISERPLMAYAGCIQGLHINETGEKGGYLLTFETGKTPQFEAINTSSIVWEQLHVTIDAESTLEGVLKTFQEKMRALPQRNGYYFVRFVVKYSRDVKQKIVDALLSEDVLKWGEQSPYYIVEIKCVACDEKVPALLDDNMQAVWLKLQQEHLSKEHVQQGLSLLRQNKVIATYFDDLLNNQDDIEDMMLQARRYVEQAIGGNEDVH